MADAPSWMSIWSDVDKFQFGPRDGCDSAVVDDLIETEIIKIDS
jgi:hypothetical protein